MSKPRRCEAVGCGRFVSSDRQFCARHDRPGSIIADAKERSTSPEPSSINERAKIFEQRLASKNYLALFDPRVIRVMNDAAAHLEKNGLGDEIGALRFVMARLLAEEEDITRLAGNVSRLVSVTVQAAKARRAISGEVANGLIEALTTILVELEH